MSVDTVRPGTSTPQVLDDGPSYGPLGRLGPWAAARFTVLLIVWASRHQALSRAGTLHTPHVPQRRNEIMCRPATCPQCGKATWAGCGQHVDSVMSAVPVSQRCSCERSRHSGGRTRRRWGLFHR